MAHIVNYKGGYIGGPTQPQGTIPMSQHFLLSAAARTLSVLEVAGMSDDASFALFKRLRRGDRDEVGCPLCGLVHKHYFRPARQIWRCAGCG